MIYKNYTMNWDISDGPSRSAMFAVTLLIALLMWSCGGQKVITQTTQNHVTDSVRERIITTVTQVKVPESRVSLRLTAKEVTELQPRMMFQEQSGQAAIRVEYRDSLIVVTATCDSLQILAESRNREIYRLRQELSQQDTLSEKPHSWWDRIKTAISYIIVGMILGAVVSAIKRNML